jgi:MarR family transcriptional regulator, lower aerobic nicotinate degradation pathway regulator
LKDFTFEEHQDQENENFLDDHLAYLLTQASHVVSREFQTCLSDTGVTVIEWRVLSTLIDHPRLSVGALQDRVICKQSTLSKAIDRMETKGWVTRSLDVRDRRKIYVTIDPPGLEIAGELLSKATKLEQSELEGFSRKEISTLKKVLRNLITHCST